VTFAAAEKFNRRSSGSARTCGRAGKDPHRSAQSARFRVTRFAGFCGSRTST